MKAVFKRSANAVAGIIRPCARFFSTRPALVRSLEISAALVPFIFILFTMIIQFLHPGYNPWQDAISALVWGPFGWVQTTIFYLLAFSLMVLVLKLFSKAGKRARFRAGVMMLALMAFGVFMVATNPTEAPGVGRNLQGMIHLQSTAVLIFMFPAACFLLAPGLHRCFYSKKLYYYTLVTGVLSLLLLATTAVLVQGNFGWVGTAEKALMVNGVAWLQVLNLQAL